MGAILARAVRYFEAELFGGLKAGDQFGDRFCGRPEVIDVLAERRDFTGFNCVVDQVGILAYDDLEDARCRLLPPKPRKRR